MADAVPAARDAGGTGSGRSLPMAGERRQLTLADSAVALYELFRRQAR